MAFAGTVTYAKRSRMADGRIKMPFSVVLDSSYDTGGETVGEGWDNAMVSEIYLKPDATYTFSYDPTQDLLIAATHADGDQVADTTNLSGVTLTGHLMLKY